MSKWLALAEQAERESHTPPDSMTKTDKNTSIQPKGGFCQVLSNCQVKVESASQPRDTDTFRHGKALGDRPKTWTGKVVSLEEWRALSEWDRHGPYGRHWNGKTRQWEESSS